MPVTVVKNSSGATIQPETVIKAAKITSVLGSWSGAMAINANTAIPSGSAGKLRIVVGPGAGSCVVTLKASVIAIGFVQTVQIPITGPGVYEWPPGQSRVAALCKSLATDVAPGGAMTLEFDAYTGVVGTDAAALVLGIASRTCAAGLPLNIISGGATTARCVGGWTRGDELVAAADGALRKRAMGETGLDRVAWAEASAIDGDSGCSVTVDLAAV